MLFLVLVFCTGLGGRAPHNSLLGWLVPAATAAEQDDLGPIDVAPGLMWNRSGLPAVFPLQVKTSAGEDYFLTLIDAKTGKETLAAFIIGGSFFKVLVPPGTFVVRFAFGDIWQGETKLFGPETMTSVVELERPLTFKVTGYGRKSGHLVDLTINTFGLPVMAAVKGQSICQTVDTEFAPLWKYRHIQEVRQYRLKYNRIGGLGSYRTRDSYKFPGYHRGRVFYPSYSVRSRFCG